MPRYDEHEAYDTLYIQYKVTKRNVYPKGKIHFSLFKPKQSNINFKKNLFYIGYYPLLVGVTE